jgi:hypothetical protein
VHIKSSDTFIHRIGLDKKITIKIANDIITPEWYNSHLIIVMSRVPVQLLRLPSGERIALLSWWSQCGNQPLEVTLSLRLNKKVELHKNDLQKRRKEDG